MNETINWYLQNFCSIPVTGSPEYVVQTKCFCQEPQPIYSQNYSYWSCGTCGKFGDYTMDEKELADKVEKKNIVQTQFNTIKDSGERRETITGAVRDRQQGKGRYDLITPIGLRRLALHYENGSRKYGDRNWERGLPLSWFIDSAIRHLFNYLEGDRSEDHMASAAWNALGFIHTEELIRKGKLPKELDDIKTTERPLIDEANNAISN